MANGESTEIKRVVRLGRVESVDLFEIKENELELFEKGAPSDLQLNFAIFLLSTAFATICSLATATFSKPIFQMLFLIIAIVGVLLGAYLLISWWRNHTSLKDVCKKIRQRIPPALARENNASTKGPPAEPPR